MSLVAHLGECLALLSLAGAPLPLAAWIAARSESEESPRHFGHQWLVLCLASCGLHILIGVGLGSVGLLALPWVYGLELFVLFLGAFLWWRHGDVALRLLPGAEPLSVHGGFFLVFWILGAALLWHVLRFPTENYDSFAYHLPAMAWWYQDGGFRLLPDLLHAAYYSYGWEVLCLLTFFPAHEDLFIAAPNVVIWAGWGLALYLLARRAGARSVPALLATALLLSTPTVLTRIDATQPDIALAAYFTAALYLGDIALRERARWSTGLALFCILLLPGLKMSGLVYAPVALVGLLLPPLWANRRALRQWRPNFVWDARVGIGFALTGLFLGSYWYLRNWTHSGNPFGFLSIEIFGLELFAGETTRAELGRTAISSMFHVTSGDDWSVLWQVGRDWLGIGFAFLLVAFFFLRRDSSRLLPTLLITALLSFVAYWTAPYSGDNGNRGYQLTPWMNVGLRYAYPLFSAIAVTAALGFDRARLRGKIALVLPVLIAAYALMWKLKIGGVALRYAVGMGLPLSFYLLRWHSLPAWARRGYVYGPVVVALLAVFVIKSQDLRELREHQRRQNYGVLHSYMEQKVGRRATIAYMRTHRRYQLFGNTLSREIVWIVPESDDPKAWIRQLRDAGVQWVAVGTADQTEAAREGIVDVRPWLEENTDDFQLYFPAQNSKKDVALYRLIGG